MSTTDEASVDAETVIFDCKISAMEAVLQPLRKGSTHGASKVNIEYVKQTLLTLVERSDELVHLAHTVYVGKGTFNPRPGIEAATALLRRVTAIETIFINMGPVPDYLTRNATLKTRNQELRYRLKGLGISA